ncbi:MAG TPA: hypothetical protein VFA38_08195 [Nitrospirales bacterium]|nr:hypothetical protein [Nitrospirales bacterium]
MKHQQIISALGLLAMLSTQQALAAPSGHENGREPSARELSASRTKQADRTAERRRASAGERKAEPPEQPAAHAPKDPGLIF